MSRTQPNAAEVAEQLGARLNSRGNVYALGGAIAFGYWGQPRGTIDVDAEQILRGQGSAFDHAWVRSELRAMYGKRDPRLSQWDELVAEIE